MTTLPTDDRSLERYRVVKQLRTAKDDCQCANCTMWTIMWEENVEGCTEIGTAWEGDAGKEVAEDIRDLMNMAYDLAIEDKRAQIQPILAAAEAVLQAYMPQFPDSRAVDDCLVGLAAATAGVTT